MNDILKKTERLLHEGVHKAEGLFSSAEKEALKFATAAVAYLEAHGGQVLREAATGAVIAAESTPGGGEAKAAAAFASIVAVLVGEGIPVVKAAVNLAIEMALADARQAGLIAA